MFKFKKEQKIFDIGGVKVGGQPGEVPTVLIGSIFYIGHKIVTDDKKGIFDKAKAEELIKHQESWTDKTTNPTLLEVVGTTKESLINYIDYVADVTDAPFLISSETMSIMMAATQHVGEIGIQNRVIYSSIFKGIPGEVLDVIKDSGIKAAIILSRNPLDQVDAVGRVTALPDILRLSEKAGIDKPLIDVCVPGWEIGIGPASRAIYLVKDEYGLPTGMGTGNVSTTFAWGKRELSRELRHATWASMNAIELVMGGNWLLYGPVEHADYIIPSVAMTDTWIVTAMAELGIQPAVEGVHPLFKLMEM
jgi:tetrahydromethanopterin S-methyltransferase subunit H